MLYLAPFPKQRVKPWVALGVTQQGLLHLEQILRGVRLAQGEQVPGPAASRGAQGQVRI